MAIACFNRSMRLFAALDTFHPGTGFALDGDLPAHQLRQPRGYRQAEAGTAVCTGCRAISLPKGFENEPLSFFRNADTGVADREVQIYRAVARIAPRGGYPHGAPIRELDRVACQVQDNLANSGGVALQPIRDVPANLPLQLNSLAAGSANQRGTRTLKQVYSPERGQQGEFLNR